MINYLGRDLYSKINKVVGRAFRDNFVETEKSFCVLESIELSFVTVESENDLPLVELEISVFRSGESSSFKVYYLLDKSEDYNEGYISCKMWEEMGL